MAPTGDRHNNQLPGQLLSATLAGTECRQENAQAFSYQSAAFWQDR